MTKRNGQHSCKSAEHYTPAAYVEAARYVLGGIDLDPASCAMANATVQAKHYYTKDDDGLDNPWHGLVYLNPPGDPRGRLVKAFWRRACQHALFGGDDAAVLWAGYSLGPLPRLHTCEPFDDGTSCPGPIHWPLVIIGPQGPETTIGGRICWIDGVTGEPGMQPGHGNYFCLLGGNREQSARFRKRFGSFGFCNMPLRLPKRTRDLASEILDALHECGPMSKGGLARTIRARRTDVSVAVNQLAATGAIVCDRNKWSPAVNLALDDGAADDGPGSSQGMNHEDAAHRSDSPEAREPLDATECTIPAHPE